MMTIEQNHHPWSSFHSLPAPLQVKQTKAGNLYFVDRLFMQQLQDHLRLKKQWFPLVSLFVVDNLKRKNTFFDHQHRFEAIYNYFIPEIKSKFWLVTSKENDTHFISLAEYADEYFWYEKEAQEFFNVPFGRHPRSRMFLPQNSTFFPLRKDDGVEQPAPDELSEPIFQLEFSPLLRTGQDVFARRSQKYLWPKLPFYSAPYRLGLDLVEDKIAQVNLEVGHHHRGFEKIVEDIPIQSALAFTQRLNYLSPSTGAIAWCMTIEKALDLQIPDKAIAMRMIYLELDRMREHCAYLAKFFSCIPLPECQKLAFEGWHSLCEINLMSEGQRNFVTNIAIGGFMREFPMGFSSMCQDVLKRLTLKMQFIKRAICRNSSFMEQTQSVVLDSDIILKWFVTGPNARASGINLDWRRDNPYYFYSDVEFEIPLGAKGNIYDRCLIRIEEILQSIHILFQILDNLPTGQLMVLDPNYNFDLMKEMSNQVLPASIPNGVWGQTLESPNGQLCATIVADGGDKPYRAYWNGPSYAIFSLLEKILPGNQQHLTELIIASFGPLGSEVDR
jgi:NADH-quinone oxidoreductase subunit C/D